MKKTIYILTTYFILQFSGFASADFTIGFTPPVTRVDTSTLHPWEIRQFEVGCSFVEGGPYTDVNQNFAYDGSTTPVSYQVTAPDQNMWCTVNTRDTDGLLSANSNIVPITGTTAPPPPAGSPPSAIDDAAQVVN